MKLTKTVLILSLLPLVGRVLPSNARANAWDKLSVITFSNPVAVPGSVLPAGTYLFKLVDLGSCRNVVRISDKNESQLFATIVTIQVARLRPSDKTEIRFNESAVHDPQSIQAWFYPDDLTGVEFLYH